MAVGLNIGPVQTYYRFILKMGNLTDYALEWSLRDRRKILAAIEGAKAMGVPVPVIPTRNTEHTALFRRCDVLYHPPHSCTTAHSCTSSLVAAVVAVPVPGVCVVSCRVVSCRVVSCRVVSCVCVCGWVRVWVCVWVRVRLFVM